MPGKGYARDDDANYQQGKIQLLPFYFFRGFRVVFLFHWIIFVRQGKAPCRPTPPFSLPW